MIDDSATELQVMQRIMTSGREFATEFKTSAKLAAQFDKTGVPYRRGMAITQPSKRGAGRGREARSLPVAIPGWVEHPLPCRSLQSRSVRIQGRRPCLRSLNVQQSSMAAAYRGLAKAGGRQCGILRCQRKNTSDCLPEKAAEGELHFLHGKN